ncbi:hypothetical protein [Alteribacillus bidgolensis]|uniref:SprT-like protein n=1 Tax=Alteribacillus bidgolensis TaxID=930129 RepID=A0A1G8JC71_9BACI|nr:hypothetical protein [Alteribacillus bidgolensis]SDI28874.1 SprT-like protein [Alteribacillus bidgolensis]
MESGNFTLNELYKSANDMCLKHWGVEYSDQIELVHTNWSVQNAVFIYDRGTGERIIRMSTKRNAIRSKEGVLQSLLHELVHWRLHLQGLPCRDEDPEFIEECINVGANISLAKKAQLAFEQFMLERKTT